VSIFIVLDIAKERRAVDNWNRGVDKIKICFDQSKVNWAWEDATCWKCIRIRDYWAGLRVINTCRIVFYIWIA